MVASFTNAQIAELLRNVAAVYEVHQENQFRIRAYQNAAASIEQLSEPLVNLWETSSLDQVAGIGKTIAQSLDELFKIGQSHQISETLKRVPEGMFALLEVNNVGPKLAYKLATAFQLTNRETARTTILALAEQGELKKLPGISHILEKKIALAIKEFDQQGAERILLFEAEQIAQEVIAYIKQLPETKAVEVLGSLRRRSPTVGDIDIAVLTDSPAVIQESLKQFPGLFKELVSGEKQISFLHTLGRRIDVRFHSAHQWGSILQHYTGSKQHNIELRKISLEKGYSMSEYGFKKEEQLYSFSTESAVYEFLGLEFIPPELREGRGEIHRAKSHSLPKLVSSTQIKGDFHIHSNLPFPSSHDMGTSSLASLFSTAQELGYQYLGIADHNPKQTGMTERERVTAVMERRHLIEETVKSWSSENHSDLQIFQGLEVDIKPDGTLAAEDSVLESLDYVIASIHSSFSQETSEMTERLLRVISHPMVTILGHPTGRLLLRRSEIKADWELIFSACRENSVALEINASPNRLDLSDELIRKALNYGCMLVINSDAHSASQMRLMTYGVDQARRGWASDSSILNTFALTKLSNYIKKP